MREYRIVFNGFTYRVQQRVRAWWCPFIWHWRFIRLGCSCSTSCTFHQTEYKTLEDVQLALDGDRLRDAARRAKFQEVGI